MGDVRFTGKRLSVGIRILDHVVVPDGNAFTGTPEIEIRLGNAENKAYQIELIFRCYC